VTDIPRGQDTRSRHWFVDALIGGGLALCLITAAKAALPRVEQTRPATPPLATRLLPRAAPQPAPAPAPQFITFQSPAPGYPVISPFGLRRLPWEDAARLHAGVDIAAPSGLPVLAAADGLVTKVATDPGYGRFVEVAHAGGLVSRYGHLAKYAPHIQPGVPVKAGQALGGMGSTGSSTGSHLHFEIRDAQDHPLNPELFLGRSFATEADLSLKAASRIPRGVRVAYVSNIPAARRKEMEAKADEFANSDAAVAEGARSAGAYAVNTAESTHGHSRHGRPHGRFRLHEAG
jgi:hypothetical protein